MLPANGYIIGLLTMWAAVPGWGQEGKSGGMYPDHLQGLSDPEGRFENNLTPTWEETVALFAALAQENPQWAHWMVIGKDDGGADLHALVLGDLGRSTSEPASLESLRNLGTDRVRVMVNNAIHPGEPCGVDASLAWTRDLLQRVPDWRNEMVVAIIPVYNVSGARNRNTCSRANQDGPRAYGFRGNARNLDLNRDFVKMDALNSFAFARLFHAFDPDVLVDTHTTNGADYQHAMTLITTQPDKAGPVFGPYLRQEVDPRLYRGMEKRGFPMAPYVTTRAEVPDSGLVGFLETPRYSTGYAMLWGTLGFVTEAHMLKPFPERVAATYAILLEIESWARADRKRIRRLRTEEMERWQAADALPVRWKHDAEAFDWVPFRGYAAVTDSSEWHSGTRLRYDRSQPWSRDVPFYNHWDIAEMASLPEGYVLGQAWREVVERLAGQTLPMLRFDRDTLLELEVAYISTFKSGAVPYEGHHPNAIQEVVWRNERVLVRAGDWYIPSEGRYRRFLAETLDPMGHDAFLVWNFFDSALQQKEWYSAYVFEDTAKELLEQDADLRARWQAARAQHPEWAQDGAAELDWVYRNSPYMEPSANRYPVFRMVQNLDERP